MSNLSIHQGLCSKSLLILSAERSLRYGVKFRYHKERYLLLNNHQELFYGQFINKDKDEDEDSITFKYIRDDVLDFDCKDDKVYVVNKFGLIYSSHLNNLTWNQEFVDVKAEFCCVNCNNNGILLISNDNQLYGIGDFGKIINYDKLKVVEADTLSKENVMLVSSGEDFVLISTQKREKIFNEVKRSLLYDKYDELLEPACRLDYKDWRNIYKYVPEYGKRKLEGDVFLKVSVDRSSIFGSVLNSSGVSSFGKVNKGQLGTGDNIKRDNISNLRISNVTKIASCDSYSTALTVDGRLYIWGELSEAQANTENAFHSLSTPTIHKKSSNVLDVACNNKKTFILSNDLKIYEMQSKDDSFLTYEINTSEEKPSNFDQLPFILAAGQFILVNHFFLDAGLLKLYADEKLVMQKMLTFFRDEISEGKLTFCWESSHFLYYRQCKRLFYLLMLNLKSLKKYLFEGDFRVVLLILMHEELIYLYRSILKIYCDCECLNLMDNKDNKMLMIVFQNIKIYIEIIEFVIKNTKNLSEFDETKLCQAKSDWLTFQNEEYAEDIYKFARRTKEFWLKEDNQRFHLLMSPDRRIILDSADVPLKLIETTIFQSTPRFLLFADIFCYSSSVSTLVKYPLQLIWVSTNPKDSLRNRPKDKHRYVFNIITPEEVLICYTLNAGDRQMWLNSLKNIIMKSLKKDLHKKQPIYRYFGYKFQKHLKYPNYDYMGTWLNGKMDGIGSLDGSGKTYLGEFSNGEIMGYGKQTAKVGDGSLEYEGDFADGKCSGYGKFRSYKNAEFTNYTGYFINDTFSGFGSFQTNSYQYSGDFVNDNKEGFGVMDDTESGSKYIGMFSNNKKQGPGILITTNGHYYAGCFVNDGLSPNSEGLVIFPTGMYYRGEMALDGPYGRGTFYHPEKEVISEYFELDDTNVKMCGHFVTGSFTGTWENVKISNATMLMNQTFNKNPVLHYNVSAEQKWKSVFKCFFVELFGHNDIVRIRKMDTNTIWNRVAIYITRSKRKEEMRLKNFECRFSQTGLDDSTAAEIKQNGVNNLNVSNLSNGSLKSSMSDDSRLSVSMTENGDNESIKSFSSVMSKDDDEFLLMPPQNGCSNLSPFKDLEFVPNFCIRDVGRESLEKLKDYLNEAFRNTHHPLYNLFEKLSSCFYSAYSCWKFSPNSILCEPAMNEWISIVSRIYSLVLRILFPALPPDTAIVDGEIVSYQTILYPILLTQGIYSALFVLYASKCSKNDEIYRQRILMCEKKTDDNLIELLDIDSSLIPVIKHRHFQDAINSLNKFKETCCPGQMMDRINEAFKFIDCANNEQVLKCDINTDTVLQLMILLIVKSNLPQLGAEICLLEDLLQNDQVHTNEHAQNDFCLTTMKASYQHIISDNFFVNKMMEN